MIKSALQTLIITAIMQAFFISPSHAISDRGTTLSSKISPIHTSGNLIGCKIDFIVARNDQEYNRGGLTAVSGQLNYLSDLGLTPSFILKLGITYDNQIGTFYPPEEAFLMNGYTSNSVDFKQTLESENGFRSFIFNAEENSLKAVIENIIINKRITIAYAMTQGGLNAIFDVNLSIIDLDINNIDNSIIDDKHHEEFIECMTEQINQMSERLNVQR